MDVLAGFDEARTVVTAESTGADDGNAGFGGKWSTHNNPVVTKLVQIYNLAVARSCALSVFFFTSELRRNVTEPDLSPERYRVPPASLGEIAEYYSGNSGISPKFAGRSGETTIYSLPRKPLACTCPASTVLMLKYPKSGRS